MSMLDVPLVATYRPIAQQSTTAEPLQTLEQIKAIRHNSDEDTSIHNAVIDTAFREVFVDLVASLEITEPEFERVWRLIDTVNLLSDHEQCEPGLGFWLIEDLLDSQTIEGCRKVFDYLETRRERMTRKNFKQKSLVVLRCCNELLRRLSRAEDTVFCGRVFIYLFQSFPLGDKSSVNLRGEFHVENVTIYDEVPRKSENAIKPMEIDTDGHHVSSSGAQTPASVQDLDPSSRTGRSTPIPRPAKKDDKPEPPPDLDDLYPMFWSLQALFSAPTRLFNGQALQQFKDGISKTLSCFKYVAQTSTGSTASSDAQRGVKRKRDEMDTNGSELHASTFNPKYLTNRDLFDLEVHDIEFRRHILVQSLILIDFLLSLTPVAKSKLADITSANKSVLYAFTLSDEDQKWAQATRGQIASYLEHQNGSDGRHYHRMVNMVLSRDKNWTRWKAEGCPAISRDPIDVKLNVEARQTLQKISEAASAPLPTPNGASELAFLSRNEPLEALKQKRTRIPTLEEYYKGIQTDELDMDFATDEEEKKELEERKAGRLWRALRSARGRRFVLCEQIKNGENLRALVAGEEEVVNGEKDNANAESEADEIAADPPATVTSVTEVEEVARSQNQEEEEVAVSIVEPQ